MNDVLLGTEVMITLHKDISIDRLVADWSIGERITNKVSPSNYRTQYEYDSGQWADLVIESPQKLKLTRYIGALEEFDSSIVHVHALDLLDELLGKRIPFSVQFSEIRKPLSEYPFVWNPLPSRGWNLMRHKFYQGHIRDDLSYFMLRKDGKDLVLSDNGFTNLEKAAAPRVNQEILESDKVHRINFGTRDAMQSEASIMRYITAFHGHFQSLPEKERVMDAFKKLFTEQLFKAEHLSRQEKSGLYSKFCSLYG
jgi:hypothetical protein